MVTSWGICGGEGGAAESNPMSGCGVRGGWEAHVWRREKEVPGADGAGWMRGCVKFVESGGRGPLQHAPSTAQGRVWADFRTDGNAGDWAPQCHVPAQNNQHPRLFPKLSDAKFFQDHTFTPLGCGSLLPETCVGKPALRTWHTHYKVGAPPKAWRRPCRPSSELPTVPCRGRAACPCSPCGSRPSAGTRTTRSWPRMRREPCQDTFPASACHLTGRARACPRARWTRPCSRWTALPRQRLCSSAP